ncbi:MAG: signal peptidase II [Planctomycetes bacterium]|nr:signal peptidase II [Planctomycetota bacterium]MCB9904284.1 signal peptidase II [Planctomycetota bacterium]
MAEERQAAGRSRPGGRTLLFRFCCAALLVAMDLWTKAAVFAWLTPLEVSGELERTCVCGHQRMHVLGENVNWFSFMLSKNPGAAFGGFSGYPYVLVVGRIAAVLFLIWMLLRTPKGRPWFTAALVLVLGGALGNLYDNLFLIDPNTSHPFGEVRDFIDVYFARWNYHFPTFNVADSGITVGAVLLFLTSFSKDEPAEAPDDAPAEAEQPTEEATAVAQDLLTK